MDDAKKEWHGFPNVIQKWEETYLKYWTSTHPVAFSQLSANKIYDWHPSEKKHKILDEHKNINYSIDEYGFRYYPTLKKNLSKKIFCFGCENTFGKGLLDEDTWPYKLARAIGEDCLPKNYGVVGSSLEYNTMCFYQLMKVLPKEEYPNAVFFLVPDPFRCFYIGNKQNRSPLIKHIDLAGRPEDTLEFEIEKYQYTLDESKMKDLNYYAYTSAGHTFIRCVKYFKFINQIAKNRNIPWFWYSVSPFFSNLPQTLLDEYVGIRNYPNIDGNVTKFTQLDQNRDCSGPGAISNQTISDTFRKLYE
jgi:hypothetical protein